jgi:hypothetical protein
VLSYQEDRLSRLRPALYGRRRLVPSQSVGRVHQFGHEHDQHFQRVQLVHRSAAGACVCRCSPSKDIHIALRTEGLGVNVIKLFYIIVTDGAAK